MENMGVERVIWVLIQQKRIADYQWVYQWLDVKIPENLNLYITQPYVRENIKFYRLYYPSSDPWKEIRQLADFMWREN